MELFPAAEEVREMQAELDATIQEGVANIIQLLKNTEAGGTSTSAAARVDDEDRYTASRRQQAYLQNNGQYSRPTCRTTVSTAEAYLQNNGQYS